MNNILPDQLNPSLVDFTGQKRYWAEKSMDHDLNDYDRINEDTFNRIIWHAVKGLHRPYPIL
jgi:hypothetical protein